MSQLVKPFTGSSEPRARGVYFVEPQDLQRAPANPPEGPSKVYGVEVVDSMGRTIGATWMLAELVDESWAIQVWNWLDKKDPGHASPKPPKIHLMP